jgi:hypothetical protein
MKLSMPRIFFAIVASLGGGFVQAEDAVCVSPGCNSVVSDGSYNTAVGSSVMPSVSSMYNTGVGYGSLDSLTTGTNNTAVGAAALASDSVGGDNTAVGSAALGYNLGTANTAVGANALPNNSDGTYNTAVGVEALFENTTGNDNVGIGRKALYNNSTGSYTTAVGAYALSASTTGGYDTGFGAYTLNDNTSGSGNTAFGYAALRSTTTGSNNIGFGYQSLYQDATGSNNIAMGYQAAYNLYNGSNTIEIGSLGGAGDNNLIRIGSTQSATFIAGVAGAQVTGSAVYVTSSGQLGVLASSERYKTDVVSIGASTERLQQLRPVSFHLKTDPKGAVQYGLIAEEVDTVYPELVIRDDKGQIQGVRYEELAPMLLNEVQRQAAEIRELKTQLAELNDLKKELHAAVRQLKPTDNIVARQ